MEVKHWLAEVRYIEAQQQKAVNWLLPGLASVLETTIAYEQVAVDLTAWVARMEPDPYLKQAYHFGVPLETEGPHPLPSLRAHR
ncbi:hypothetical protein SAMN05216276_110521 [Streptosporangium subroseum]|uniref:Uncharacterized protein n=1 Tax=Streptosporangium subroseum TaxID=106412 RepID=A0A239PA66_9ACTN|nr:hypothetical protein [Streptosporangium subroseum]SNT63835.1 hypothetical protein SAMN05216276_110521 [Streptosporangium subroseum]